MNNRYWLSIAIGLLCAGEAWSQPVIDGTADASYGPALSVQNTRTHYGDNDLGDLIATRNGGSEIDQVFGVISGDRLYVAVTGNLENNFNKLQIFIDSVEGAGVHSIEGFQLPAAVDAFCCGGLGTTDGALQRLSGLTFDAGFDADYYLSFTHGREGVGLEVGPNPGDRELNFWAISAHYADLTQGTAGAVVRAGMQLAPEGLPNVLRANGPAGTLADPAYVPTAGSFDTNPTTALIGPMLPGLAQGALVDKNYALSAGGCIDDTGTGCLAKEIEFVLPPVDAFNDLNHRDMENTIDLRLALNNSNTEGVSGTGGPDFALLPEDDPESVRTGIEFSILLSKIGNPTGPVKLTAFVGGTGHDHTSNQFSGTGILQPNVGSFPPNLELDYPENQYVVVPVAGGVPGDYNANGMVDAADYVTWRESLGSSTTLPNDASPGMVTQADYDVWRANFGITAGSGSQLGAAAPESAAIVFALIAALAASCTRTIVMSKRRSHFSLQLG